MFKSHAGSDISGRFDELIDQLVEHRVITTTEMALLKHLSKNYGQDAKCTTNAIGNTLKQAPGAVYANVSRTKKTLETFYANERRIDFPQIDITTRQNADGQTVYQLAIMGMALTAVQQLWASYSDPSAGGVDLILPSPLFWRNNRIPNVRVRVMTVNDDKSILKYQEEKDSDLPDLSRDYTKCFHYLAKGDVVLAMELLKYFYQCGKSPEVHFVSHPAFSTDRSAEDASREAQWREGEANRIVIGNARTNWAVDHFQEKVSPNFYVLGDNAERIENRKPLVNEEKFYRDKWPTGPKKTGVLHSYFGRFRLKNGKWLTLIETQNGPSHEVIARTLTQNHLLLPVLRKLGIAQQTKADHVPIEFELLFRIPVAWKSESVGDAEAELVAWRTRAL